jgi:prolyl oligopeptidase
VVLVFLLAAAALLSAQDVKFKKPPETRLDNVKETIHGVEIVDPYRWLEDQESEETRAWIDAQNEYTHSFIDPLPGRDKLSKRIIELMKIDRISIPFERNGRYFLSKRSADQDLFVIYMRDGLDGEDEVLIDPHAMSPDKTTSVNLWEVSKDGTVMIYAVREGGEDEVTIRLFDIDRRVDLPDVLPKGRYFGIAFLPDKSGLYYSRHGAEGSRVYYHAMGSDPDSDLEIFGEGFGPDKGIGVGISDDGRHLGIMVFHGSAGQKSEIYYKDLVEDSPIKTLVNDIDARFVPQMGGDKLFLETNWEAPNGRVLLVDINNPARENWKELVPETDAVIRGTSLADGKLCINYMENVVSRVKIFEADGRFIRDISFPTLGSVSGIAGQWDRDEAFFVFSSFHVPTRIYRYNMADGAQEVWARLDVPVDTDKIDVKQVWYESKDGTKVPMFVVHAKGLKLDGNNPALLAGYGGFNVSLTPRFSSTAVIWAENGGVYVIPNLRGGGEFGEDWHRAGMFENKQNVFDDFISAAEWLIDNKYTSSSKLAIAGGSNGGLLVGAAMVQRPELFEAVVCTYPLLDMLRYHMFMVARFWVSEYGSSEDPEHFKYLHAYSPYHNVEDGVKYPATLFITGDSDTRVAPLHARKMTALLQAHSGSENPILLLYDTKAGHSGGRPLSKQIEDETDEMSFLFWQLGMF